MDKQTKTQKQTTQKRKSGWVRNILLKPPIIHLILWPPCGYFIHFHPRFPALPVPTRYHLWPPPVRHSAPPTLHKPERQRSWPSVRQNYGRDVPARMLGSMVRINGLFHLLVNGVYGGFLKWRVSPTTMGFPTKWWSFWGGDWGYHHLRKHPYWGYDHLTFGGLLFTWMSRVGFS